MTKSAGRSNGGWSLVLVSAAVLVALYLPWPREGVLAIGPEWSDPDTLRSILALILAAFGLWAFRRRFWPRSGGAARQARNVLLLILMQAVLLRVALEFERSVPIPSWDWLAQEAWLWTPWFLVTGLAVTLLGTRFGILTSLTGALLLYLRADPGPLPLVGSLLASLVGIYLLRRTPNRSRVLRAGIGSGVVLGGVAALQGLLAGATVWVFIEAAVAPALIGLVSALIVLSLLPLAEWVLGELSDLTLAEYGSEHPLLEKLKEEAPGTWNHTLNVADLAEKAAAAIGARALFCKTAAYFHDVGKLMEPSLFAENIQGTSPHDTMDPRVSAQRILDHVSHGLELARKHRLPGAFREIIAEHHGVSTVRFFYTKACSQLKEGEDPEAIRPHFSYAGPPPSTRESGIISLADMVEAATRSLGARPQAEVQAFVCKLIADRVADGTMRDCPLTLAELARVQETFLGWLKARAHHRPAYPTAAKHPAGAAPEGNATQMSPLPA